ncbi:putative polyketide biosynthesis enoyl-CoA hydratase PksH [mine drainage metagenome]|uniref:Putative polyketide biosynthesis enoyl-CoA hydratase PksH n=1 Tax=mine drainage metagenome TaxID=410659 RepID=A0A1J5SGQ0_9ZZZZ
MNDAYVKYSVENNIGEIEFFTPQHNSLPSAILKQLAETIINAGADEESKVLILKSGGNKTFCAGASFDEILLIENEKQGVEFFSGFAHVINAMRQCPKFIIGRIQGKAIGGGVGLASSCDYNFATIFSEIKLSELAIGIGPFVVGPAVERKIGTTATSELTIDATHFRSAQWAKEKGLFVEIFDTIELMDEAIFKLATTLATSSSEAMKEIKKIFWSGTESWNELLLQRAAMSGKLILSEETKKTIASFKNK